MSDRRGTLRNMAEQTKPKPQMQQPQHHEMWSAISPTDLGLKAGYWTGKEGDPMRFRPIVGWVSVVGRAVPAPPEQPPTNGFYPVVLGDHMYPVGANLLPEYSGVFLKEMTEQQAKVAALAWLTSKAGAEPQPNVRGTGVA